MYKAKISFSGLITAVAGEILNINDDYIAKDLLRAGYIERISSSSSSKKPEKSSTKNKKKK